MIHPIAIPPDEDYDVENVQFAFAPREWQMIAAQGLARPGVKSQLLICARRSGKSAYLGMQLVLGALRPTWHGKPFIGRFFAPTKLQASSIIAATLRDLIQNIPGASYSPGTMTATFANGATISLHASDEPDAVRGTSADMVCIDEAQFMSEDGMAAAIRPILVDREGILILSGTPNGVSLLTSTYDRVVDGQDPRWDVQLWPWDKAKAVSAEEVAAARRDSPNELIARQEWDCDMSASSQFAILPTEGIKAAQALGLRPKALRAPELAHFPVVLGCDVGGNNAEGTGDRSVLVALRGDSLEVVATVSSDRHSSLPYIVAQAISDYRAQTCFVDTGGGWGSGLLATLDALGVTGVVPVNFSNSPDGPRAGLYHNMRAQLYGEFARWLKKGGRLPPGTALAKELGATEFKMTGAGKIQLESKLDVKRRLGGAFPSPDTSDAMALCFRHPTYIGEAEPVVLMPRAPDGSRLQSDFRRPWAKGPELGRRYDPFTGGYS